MSQKRIIATFVPQAWVNDYAVEIDGRVEFDVTDQILAMPEEKRSKIRDDDYTSDHLVPDDVGADHTGPFRVEVVQAIEDYFAEEKKPSETDALVRMEGADADFVGDRACARTSLPSASL